MSRTVFVPLLLASSGCFGLVTGSGDIVSETRNVSAFDAIDVCCGWDVVVEQGDEESLRLRGDDNIVDRIDADVIKGTLVIDYHRPTTVYEPTRRIEVRIGIIDFTSFSGSGGIDAEWSDVSTESMDINLSGGSTLGGGELRTQTLDVNVSGGGWVELSGDAPTQYVDLSGGSRYRAGSLESETLDADLSGGSTATVWVTERIDAGLSGGSILRYYGKPVVDQQTSGGSRIESLGEKK